ncbi:hypothetical protein BDV93DRAFT_582900 [Ceratobasidium sp. AG-I]|nr:hypothetical protein BDV93DRAFT_582900 [Ceratobasidium sp. AG-I]
MLNVVSSAGVERHCVTASVLSWGRDATALRRLAIDSAAGTHAMAGRTANRLCIRTAPRTVSVQGFYVWHAESIVALDASAIFVRRMLLLRGAIRAMACPASIRQSSYGVTKFSFPAKHSDFRRGEFVIAITKTGAAKDVPSLRAEFGSEAAGLGGLACSEHICDRDSLEGL